MILPFFFLHVYTYTSSSLIRANARIRSFAWVPGSGEVLWLGKSSANRGSGKTRCWGPGECKLCREMRRRAGCSQKSWIDSVGQGFKKNKKKQYGLQGEEHHISDGHNSNRTHQNPYTQPIMYRLDKKRKRKHFTSPTLALLLSSAAAAARHHGPCAQVL